MDRYPAKPILLAAVGMFGIFFFLMIAVGAAIVAVRFLTTGPHVSSSAPEIVGGAVVVGLVSLWLTYLALRSVVRRIKEANQAALAGRAVWEASFQAERAERDRGVGSSAGE